MKIGMRSEFLRRLMKLETVVASIPTGNIRYGWRIPLPPDFVGERHEVVEDCTQIVPGLEWCNFVEYPGRAPVALKDVPGQVL